MILIVLLGILFILCNYSNDHPPLYDIISPIVTLNIAIYSLYSSSIFITIIMTMGLIMESLADFLMNKDNMKLSIRLFSFGHLIRQFSFLSLSISSLLFISITLLIIKSNSIINYALIIFFSAVHVSISQGMISFGYLVFIISDLIIAYELLINDVRPRYLRVIGVPLLYWISQYLLIHECIYFSNNSN